MTGSRKPAMGRSNNDEAFFQKEKLRIEAFINNGNFVQARKLVDRLCKKFKNNPEAWFISGMVCTNQNDLQRAILSFKRSIALAPGMPVTYLNLGIALRVKGQLNESFEALKKSVELQPDLMNAYRELGIVSNALDHYDDAVKYITRTIDYAPNDPMAWISLGNIHEQNSNYVDAEACYQKALDVDAKSVAACVNLCNMLKAQQKVTEALSYYKRFLSKYPDCIDIIYNLALLYQSEGFLSDAESYYRKAIAVDALHTASNNNLGLVLLLQDKFDDAIHVFKALIKSNPKNFDARRNLALVYREMNELSLAEEQFNQILKVDKDNVVAWQEISLVLLQSADFSKGWKAYEWRLKDNAGYLSFLPYPVWDGVDATDRSILLIPEQGVGDEIMFASCVNDLVKVAKHVVLVCDDRLVPLFKRSFAGVTIVGQSKENNISINATDFIEKLPEIDAQLSSASLPMVFRNTIEEFKSAAAGYLVADELAVEIWRERFKAVGSKLNVGISWRGGHVTNTQLKRSIGLEHWGEIFKLQNVQFVNLQYGECKSELQNVTDLFGVKVHEWDVSQPLIDMDDFAAKINALDLVISIDNSTVHLAGSLGVDTWLLQPYSPDWRWLPEQTGSYWYSSIKQYRQNNPGKWESVLKRVAADLSEINLHRK